jgi:hypothetical protein
MKVNAKVGGFNLRMSPGDYPKRWQDLMARGSIKQEVAGKVMDFFPAIILIGKVPAVVFPPPPLVFREWGRRHAIAIKRRLQDEATLKHCSRIHLQHAWALLVMLRVLVFRHPSLSCHPVPRSREGSTSLGSVLCRRVMVACTCFERLLVESAHKVDCEALRCLSLAMAHFIFSGNVCASAALNLCVVVGREY